MQLNVILRHSATRLWVGSALLVMSHPALAVPKDLCVQPPELKPPGRGSVAGALAGYEPGAEELSRGGFSFGGPFSAPSSRGSLLANVFPVYSPSAGLSEWGQGWHASLTITRSRVTGFVDFATDDFVSPWGRLVRGDDGAYYPIGAPQQAVARLVSGNWQVRTPDGTVYEFRLTDALSGPRGAYSWCVSRVVSVRGDATDLRYDRNSSGRPFLVEVRYGRFGSDAGHSIVFDYEPLALTTVSHASGGPVRLDRRVKAVRMLSRDVQTGAFAPVWRYDLQYEAAKWGPAFFLTSVTRYGSKGTAEPATTYKYNLQDGTPENDFQRTPLQANPVLTALLAQRLNAAQPGASTTIDIDKDGRADLEYVSDHSLMRQTDSGWVVEPLPPADADVYAPCRPSAGHYNRPRMLTFLTPEDPEPSVLVFTPIHPTKKTEIAVCDRAGHLKEKLTIEDSWEPSETVHVVDLDRDGRPDLVGANHGVYRVARNTSTPGHTSFDVLPLKSFGRDFSADAVWVHDVNGDGLLDLIVRSGGLGVFYGLGNFEFSPTPEQVAVLDRGDGPMGFLEDYGMTFEDVNNDGLTDLILYRDIYASIYMNNGRGGFRIVSVHALDDAWPNRQSPVIGDLSGSGNVEVAIINGHVANIAQLTHAGTSLLREIDDGKGTRVNFTYARAKAVPGIRHRPSLVSSISITRAGEGTKTYRYDYEQPTLHTKGLFLVGFDLLNTEETGSSHRLVYQNDDFASGLLVKSEAIDDDVPNVKPFEEAAFSLQTFHGVPWYRPERRISGLRSDSASVVTTSYYDTYERDFCPTVVRTENRWGTLTTTSRLANPSKLAGLPHCLESFQSVQGRHQDSALDFAESVSVARNDVGQVTAVTELGAPADLTTQQVLYDGHYAVSNVTSAGKGTVRADRDGPTGMLTAVTAPDGVRLSVAERHPVTDAIMTFATDRGGAPYLQSYEYDDLGILTKRWDNVNGGSSGAPLETFVYTYPDAGTDKPGHIVSRLTLGAGQVSETAEVFSGSGASVGIARAIPGGWRVGDVRITNAQQRMQWTRSAHFVPRARLQAEGASFVGLTGQTDLLGTAKHSGLGRSLWSTRALAEAVESKTELTYQLDSAGLWTSRSDAGVLAERRLSDASGSPVALVDAYGNTTAAVYDALGRVRRIRFPEGDEQRADYDAHGRISRVWRKSVGGETYGYDQVTGLLKEVAFLDRDGTEERRLAITYDALGRKAHESYVSHTGGAARAFLYVYDGGTSSATGQRGFLTEVHGVGFDKELSYRSDGKLSRRRIALAGWQHVENGYEYFGDRDLKAESVEVTAAGGGLVTRQRFETVRDASGRLQGLAINGQSAIVANYDGTGLLAGFSATGGDELALSHDARTQRLDGVRLERADGRAGDRSWTWGSGGDIVEERMSGGDAPRKRAYAYDARHYMTSWRDGVFGETYAYIPNTRRIHGTYPLDRAGRITRFNGYTLSYDAAGQLQSAASSVTALAYLYDEEGQRVAKLKDGQPVAAYLDGDLIGAQGHWRPVALGSYSVGAALNGNFVAWLADPRGTTVEPEATVWPGPFGTGVFPGHLFAGQHLDLDTGMVRVGVRDLIPAMGEFTTPDSVYVHDSKACIEHPTECNLYSYALHNPMSFADPTGSFVETAWDAANITLGIHSIASWDSKTPLGHKAMDVLGLGVDVAAAAIPFLPGGAGSALKAMRAFETRSELAQGIVRLHGPLNPGPLPHEIAKNFRSATYKAYELAEPTILGRVWGGKAGELSSWWSHITAKGPLQAQLDAALVPEWGNTAERLALIRVPAGETIFHGAAAEQLIEFENHVVGRIIGGGDQAYLRYVNRDWLIKW